MEDDIGVAVDTGTQSLLDLDDRGGQDLCLLLASRGIWIVDAPSRVK